MTALKLSVAQQRVMSCLGKGWSGLPGGGSAVLVNGKRMCNVDTMTALKRAGLVKQDEQRCWIATEEGKQIAESMNL